MSKGRWTDAPPLLRASCWALWPLLVGVGCAALLATQHMAAIEARTVFLVQRWLVIAFVLNSAIIFWGTVQWALDEFSHGGLGMVPSLLGVLSLVLCGVDLWSWYTFLWPHGAVPGSNSAGLLSDQLHGSEMRALGIFVMFLFIDAAASLQIRGKQGVPASKRDFYWRCVWIVDLPVVVVVGLVTLIRGPLVDQSKQITEHGVSVLKDVVLTMQTDKPPLSIYGEVVGDSFAVGAILGHILLSQVAFAILKLEYRLASLKGN